MSRGFRKILVANRGEIAIRVIRAIKELGKQSVAIRTPDDRSGIWSYFADELYEISDYLNIDEIIDVAKKSKVDAIHPGYGFLSEKEEFALACEKAGIKFVGPSPKSLRMSGDKAIARQKAKEAGVPIVPGTDVIENLEKALEEARKIGFPVLIKAAGGGGGKGMRPVFDESEFINLFRQASEEARSAFGDPRIYIEKYIVAPKHIEVQILGDEYGNMVYLFERDCSLQRRNQKVIEESPSPLLPNDVRLKMCESAVKIMKKINYFNAGTVEFIVDENWNFYFIEINARIQVEHPVTEMITGIDLIKRQIKIAEGEKLDISQEDIRQVGHAMELRIYAEDPDNDFMPSGGYVSFYKEPSIPGVRCDGWLYSGCQVPSKYDPLLLKLIVKGETRDETINKTLIALDELKIQGIKNNIPFFRFVLNLPEFREGKINTWSMKDIIRKYSEHRRALYNQGIEAAIILGAYLCSNGVMQGISSNQYQENLRGGWKVSGWKISGRVLRREQLG